MSDACRMLLASSTPPRATLLPHLAPAPTCCSARPRTAPLQLLARSTTEQRCAWPPASSCLPQALHAAPPPGSCTPAQSPLCPIRGLRSWIRVWGRWSTPASLRIRTLERAPPPALVRSLHHERDLQVGMSRSEGGEREEGFAGRTWRGPGRRC